MLIPVCGYTWAHEENDERAVCSFRNGYEILSVDRFYQLQKQNMEHNISSSYYSSTITINPSVFKYNSMKDIRR